MNAIDLIYERDNFTLDRIVSVCNRHNIHCEIFHNGQCIMNSEFFVITIMDNAVVKRFSRRRGGGLVQTHFLN